MKRSRQIVMGLVALAVLAGAALYHLNRIDEAPLEVNESVQISPALVERGEYLARVGNCMACHTVAGQKSFSGGRRDRRIGAVGDVRVLLLPAGLAIAHLSRYFHRQRRHAAVDSAGWHGRGHGDPGHRLYRRTGA